MNKDIQPGRGERGAISGYHAQYTIAADLIYKALLEGTLEWINIADPKAGRVDDIQIATTGRLDAYQVKWGMSPGNFSFQNLTATDDPNLINQLADGWTRLKRINPDRRVIVHLITRDIPSPRAVIPFDGDRPTKHKFHNFIEECWKDRSWAKSGIDSVPQGWRSAIEEIQKASYLDNDVFLEFVQACEFLFGYKLPSDELYMEREGTQRKTDIDQIVKLLLDIVASDHQVVRFMKKELLGRLGWKERFAQYFVHNFPVDELYQPIKATATELESSLNQFQQGYLALVGTPGSGKSTILTQTLGNKTSHRVVRYYAFVPNDSKQARGEASSFLHDLSIGLKEYDILGRNESLSISREAYQRKFGDQLEELRQKWQDDRIMTFILVDGLDYIEREMTPERSLIEDLPPPNTIPEGVLFILGTQTIELDNLSDAIKAQLKEQNRTLKMEPLDREAIHKIVDNISLPVSITAEQKDKTFQLSSGHPLALIYLLKRLGHADSTDRLQQILDESDPYLDHIDKEYEVYWQSLQQNSDIRDLLALVARVRIPIDPTELVSWVGVNTVRKFLQDTRHYFREETSNRWRFFHNSFRQFLLDKTSQDISGCPDVQKDRDFHKKLADFSASAPDESPWYWEELYHRASAGEWKEVIRLGIQKRFRDQFFCFRPISAIKDDIGLVLNSVKEVQDGVAIIRCILIEHELNERQYILEQTDFMELILWLRGPRYLADYVLEERSLRTDSTKALEICLLLIQEGQINIAKDIFDASEPLDLLAGNRQIGWMGRDDVELLKSWIRVAYFFRPFEKIFDIIKQLQISDDWGGYRDDQRDIAAEILYALQRTLIDTVINSEDDNKVSELKSTLKLLEDADDLLFYTDFTICHKVKGKPEASEALDRILSLAEREDLSNIDRTLIGEFIFIQKQDKEQAKAWIKGIPQPDAYRSSIDTGKWKNLSPFVQRIRLNRLLSALGKPEDPIRAVPDNSDKRYYGNVLFERNLVIIANLWGRAWSGQIYKPTEIVRELHSSIILFERKREEIHEWSSWFEIEHSAPDFFNFMIRAAAAHGVEAVCELSKAFEERWKNDNTKRFWPHSWKRHITLELYKNGDYLDRFKGRLEALEAEISVLGDVYYRTEAFSELAKAWLKVDNSQHADSLLFKLLQSTFGIYRDDDYQFSRWVNWLSKVAIVNTTSVIEDIQCFSGALVFLQDSAQGAGTQEAAVELISLVADFNPEYVLELCSWLLDKHAIYYSSMLEGLLTSALRSTDPSVEIALILTQHLLIPFVSIVPTAFAKKLAESCEKIEDAQLADQLIEELSTTIETKSLPSIRRTWWLCIIDGLQNAGIETSAFEQRLQNTPENADGIIRPTIGTKSGEILNEEDAKIFVRTYSNLLALINQVEDDSSFHWERILEPLIDSLTLDQVHELQRLFTPINPGLITTSLLTKRLAQLGHIKEAMEIQKKLLEESSPQGWNRWWDGGTRLVVLQSLIEIDPSKWRPEALNLLINDFLYEHRYPANLLDNLEDIIPILFETPPLSDLWREITEHVYQLYNFSETLELQPPAPSVSTTMSHNEMLVKSLKLVIDIPVKEIREAIHKALYQLIAVGVEDNSLKKLISGFLEGTEFQKIQGLAVLDVVTIERSKFVNYFDKQISGLCISPNYIVREIALKLAHKHKIEQALLPIDRTELPLIYQLHFQPLTSKENAIPIEALRPGESFPDIADPLDMIRPHNNVVEFLHMFSRIPLENLLQQAYRLMHKLVPDNEWNKKAEIRLESWLKATDLEITYYRLKPQVALLSISYMIAELADAGLLNYQDLLIMIQLLRLHDTFLSTRFPIKKPEEIGVTGFNHVPEMPQADWVRNGNEALSLIVQYLGSGFLALGELTQFRGLTWEKPIERRLSLVCHPKHTPNNQVKFASDIFPYNPLWYAQDYPYIEQDSELLSTVVYGHPHQLELGSTYWLAFNPLVAQQFGWQFDKDGLFRWVDSYNRIMVESLWWQDGPMDRHYLRSDEVCGEGWIVIASKDAIRVISDLFGDTIRVAAIIREYYNKETNQREPLSVVEKNEWEISHLQR